MKLLIKLKLTVDLDAIYKMCKPIDKKKCTAEIRDFVTYQVERRVNEDGWEYPSSELIAGHLISSGYACEP